MAAATSVTSLVPIATTSTMMICSGAPTVVAVAASSSTIASHASIPYDSLSNHHTGKRTRKYKYTMGKINDCINKIKEKKNDDGNDTRTIADVIKWFDLPWRTVMRWMAVMRNDPSYTLPTNLPKRGKPPLINSTNEVGLSSWCTYEAMMQRSVTIDELKQKAKEVYHH